jgi:hypothetical protein
MIPASEIYISEKDRTEEGGALDSTYHFKIKGFYIYHLL